VFELAGAAQVWRVQKMTGRRGTQEVLFDGNDQPLSVPIDATPAELRAAIEGAGYAPAGRFKLVPCDKNGQQVGDKCGYITLKGELPEDERGGSGGASEAAISQMAHAVTRAVEKLVDRDNETQKTLRLCLETLTNRTADVNRELVAGYGRVRPFVEQAMQQPIEEEEEPAAELSPAEKLQQIGAALPQIMQFIEMFKSLSPQNAATNGANGTSGSNGASNGVNGVGLGINNPGTGEGEAA
jgi:hypothetical protein